MRIQIDRGVMAYLRGLQDSQPLWEAIEALRVEPIPQDVREVNERQNRYEIFIAGHWIIYKVEVTGETVITVLLIELNI